VVADIDILWFFVTTPAGGVTLVLGSSLIVTISALEAACLMAIGFAATKGTILDARGALSFGLANAPKVLGLTARKVVRVLASLVPFVLAAFGVYWALLRAHDINYYLTERPREFVTAAVLVTLLAIVLAALVARTVPRWALALPLVLFEGTSPGRALSESAKRSAGNRSLILKVLACWALVALALAGMAAWLPSLIGRVAAPRLGGSLALLLLFLAGLVLLWTVLALVAGDHQALSGRGRAARCRSRDREPLDAWTSPPLGPRSRRCGGDCGARRVGLRGARVPHHSRRSTGAGDRPSRLLGDRSREHPSRFPVGRRAGHRLRGARRPGVG
jgi:hypothetical protein